MVSSVSTAVSKLIKKSPKVVKVRQPKRPYKRIDASKLEKHVECFTRQVFDHTNKVKIAKDRLDLLTAKLNGYNLKLEKYAHEQAFRATEGTAAGSVDSAVSEV